MSFPAIAQVDAYWEGLRAGRLMPERSEIDPRGMESALEFAFMVELVAPRVGRMRIAGNHLHDILGMEVRGMPITSFFAPDVREKLGNVIERVASTPLIAEFKISSPRSIGHPAMTGRMYLAPLGSQEDGVNRILGCLETKGPIGRAPRRFNIDQVKLRRIVETAGPIAPPRPTAPTTTPKPVKPAMQFSEAPTRFDGAPSQPETSKPESAKPESPTSKVPYLRLVKSDT